MSSRHERREYKDVLRVVRVAGLPGLPGREVPARAFGPRVEAGLDRLDVRKEEYCLE